MGIESITSDKAPAAKDFTSEMEGTLESIRKNLKKVKEQMKLNANKHCSAAPAYEIGQQVWLVTENLCLTDASQKLSERWLGPHKIIGLAGFNAVKLQLLRFLQIHPVVNISWIKPYHECMKGQTLYWPGLVHMTEDRDNGWEVDYIVDFYLKKKKLEYLIHWKAIMTQITCGNPCPILKMQKMLSMISMNLIPPPHTPSPLIQQTFFCSSKSSQSHLLK